MAATVGMGTRIGLWDGSSSLEMRLSRRIFAAGGALSGVLILRLRKAMELKSLVAVVEGFELGGSSRKVSKKHTFFQREVLLTGMHEPRFTAERISRYWNAFLGRSIFRVLPPGDYAYPFTLPLPSSLPSSCSCETGKICYTVKARLQTPLGRVQQISLDVPIAFASKEIDDVGFSLSHSAVFGGRHATGADMSVSLPRRGFALGAGISGEVIITNPRNADMKRLLVTLNLSDGPRATARGEVKTRCIDSFVITLDDRCASHISVSFEMKIPTNAPPSVEGINLLVAWVLNVVADSSPPLEMQVPVIVHLPLEDQCQD